MYGEIWSATILSKSAHDANWFGGLTSNNDGTTSVYCQVPNQGIEFSQHVESAHLAVKQVRLEILQRFLYLLFFLHEYYSCLIKNSRCYLVVYSLYDITGLYTTSTRSHSMAEQHVLVHVYGTLATDTALSSLQRPQLFKLNPFNLNCVNLSK